jgi:hypothetical protein
MSSEDWHASIDPKRMIDWLSAQPSVQRRNASKGALYEATIRTASGCRWVGDPGHLDKLLRPDVFAGFWPFHSLEPPVFYPCRILGR